MGQEISVVIPMRNESPNVEALYRELTTTLGCFARSYEILGSDAGSTDDTFALLAAIQAKDPRLRVIRFRRNFGQTAAFAAGFANARGRYIVTADGDRQNDPADIPAMIAMLEEKDLDIDFGWRKNRRYPFSNRRMASMNPTKISSCTTGVPLNDSGLSHGWFLALIM